MEKNETETKDQNDEAKGKGDETATTATDTVETKPADAEATPQVLTPMEGDSSNADDIDDPKVTKQKVVRKLPCKLTEKEMAKFGEDLNSTLDKIDLIEEKKKSANDQFKADTSLLEEAVKRLRDMVRSKAEERDVECIQETDYIHGEVRVKRLDTGEVFSRRSMMASEKQLPLTAGGKKVSEVTDHKPGSNEQEDEDCEECNGTGQVPFGDTTAKCEDCNGLGKVAPKKEPLTATLGEHAASKPAKKKRAKKSDRGDVVDMAPPEGADW